MEKLQKILTCFIFTFLLYCCFFMFYRKGENEAFEKFYHFCKSENIHESETFFIHCEIIEKGA